MDVDVRMHSDLNLFLADAMILPVSTQTERWNAHKLIEAIEEIISFK